MIRGGSRNVPDPVGNAGSLRCLVQRALRPPGVCVRLEGWVMGAKEVACLDFEVRGLHRSNRVARSAVCLTFSGRARDALGNKEPECAPQNETHTEQRARYTHRPEERNACFTMGFLLRHSMGSKQYQG